MSSTIQVRVDDELKAKSDSLFKDLGTDTTTAIRIFLTQAVAYNGFPFEIRRNSTVNSPYTPMSEESMLKKLDESKKHADQGQCRRADDVVADMRTKYGLWSNYDDRCFEQTLQNLQMAAGSLKDCENPKLRERGYKRINFISHRYFRLYRVEGSKAIIDSTFHELQDYENRIN